MRLIIFEQSETRNEVHSVCVGVVSYFGRPADLSAQASRQRCCNVIAESKNSNFEWIPHPSLPKHSVGMLNFPLNWSNFICSNLNFGSLLNHRTIIIYSNMNTLLNVNRELRDIEDPKLRAREHHIKKI